MKYFCGAALGELPFSDDCDMIRLSEIYRSAMRTDFRLGFGLMRLPKLEDGHIDVQQTAEMVDLFLEAGGSYFDTAYVYDNGESEETARKALVERYPRDRYTLATKLNVAQSPSEEAAKQQFYTSLERTGAGYFDFYLLHAIQRNNYKKYDDFHIWDYWEICKAHGKPVTVMEPVKGGILADPIPTVKSVFDEANNGLSYASWAVRFVASQENILVVLSGMSNLAQMKDNLSYMRDFRPLSEEEMGYIARAQKALDEDQSIACTACHYCTKGCPQEIPIPEIFAVANRKKGSPEFRTIREYNIVTQGHGKASDCVECGQCMEVCPQHLSIPDLLKECRELEE